MAIVVASRPTRSEQAGLYLPNQNLVRGLVGHWCYNDLVNSGSAIDDNARQPTAYGFPPNVGPLLSVNRRIPGPAGEGTAPAALYFDGSAYLTLGSRQYIADASPFTATCWARIDGGSSYRTFCRFGDSSGSPYLWLTLGLYSDGNAVCWVGNGGSFTARYLDEVGGTSPTVGRWCFYGLTWTGVAGEAVFGYCQANGGFKETSLTSFSGNLSNTSGTVNHLGGNVFGEFLTGGLYSFRLYNRVLNTGDVRAIYEYERTNAVWQWEQPLGRSMVSLGAPPPATTTRFLSLLGAGT